MAALTVDLDPESREALELEALLEVVAGHARTPMGARRIRELRPLAEPEPIRAELAAVAETRQHRAEHGNLLPGRLADPSAVLEALAIEGARPDAKALRELAAVAESASELRHRIGRLSAERYPALRGLGETLPDLAAEARAVLAHVDSEGRLADGASPELRRIRGSLRRVGERLRSLLQRRLQGPDAESVIRDDFVTERSGRFVIPVRTDAPRPVEGIVHAHSSSGATVFVEPMESVPLNNERVRLADEELEEQDRILRDWAARFARRREDVARALAGVATVDAWEARASFGDALHAVEPTVGEDQPIRLRQVRHPLLELRLLERDQHCVPLDLELDPGDQVLVVSGPNTGGKTVALKTLGLAVLMAQSGIPVPAVEARLPLYRQVRADVGDHQSIQADLSTFSAHLLAVVGFLEQLRPPALVLFDEIGTGTEPGEGAALARAVLESLLRPGVTAMATTHQGALKAWAFTTDGAASAAMEFDTTSLRPTFRVLMGQAGVSAGLDIAERIGLDPEIVARARGHLDQGSARIEATLARLRRSSAELERERERLERGHRELRVEAERSRQAQRREADERAAEGRRLLERAVQEFRKRADRELAAIRDPERRARAERRRRRAETRLLGELGRQQAELDPVPATAVAPLDGPLEPGRRVHVRSLGRDGRVVAARGERVEVRLGQVTFQVDRADLAGPAGPAPAEPAAAPSEPRRPGPGIDDGPPRELMLIGMTVDEALPELDKALDAAALAGRTGLRVVHGHGTGRLRAAVRRFLGEHDLVAGHRPGGKGEGGDGATVVKLR